MSRLWLQKLLISGLILVLLVWQLQPHLASAQVLEPVDEPEPAMSIRLPDFSTGGNTISVEVHNPTEEPVTITLTLAMRARGLTYMSITGPTQLRSFGGCTSGACVFSLISPVILLPGDRLTLGIEIEYFPTSGVVFSLEAVLTRKSPTQVWPTVAQSLQRLVQYGR